MSDKPTAAWYLAPIFLGIIGSAIMWYVLKDEEHPDSPKMVKKGWVIGIVLTLIPLLFMIPMLILMPMTAMNDFSGMQEGMQDHMRVIPEPMVQMVPAPGFEDVPEMIVESSRLLDAINECTEDVDNIGEPGRSIESSLKNCLDDAYNLYGSEEQKQSWFDDGR
jgi:hypothetical protein